MSRRRTFRFVRPAAAEEIEEDPLSGVANLFDVSLAFIVALLIALFSNLGLDRLFAADASWTMTSTDGDGRVRIVTKDRREVRVQQVTNRQLSGDGDRLGTAYRLPDGRVIYVPEGQGEP